MTEAGQSENLPHLLLVLQLAAGTDLDEGRFRPKGWQPFCAQEWLAHYLLQHTPTALQATAAAVTPGQSPAGGADSP